MHLFRLRPALPSRQRTRMEGQPKHEVNSKGRGSRMNMGVHTRLEA